MGGGENGICDMFSFREGGEKKGKLFRKIIANSCSAILSVNDESNFYAALMKDIPVLSDCQDDDE